MTQKNSMNSKKEQIKNKVLRNQKKTKQTKTTDKCQKKTNEKQKQ